MSSSIDLNDAAAATSIASSCCWGVTAFELSIIAEAGRFVPSTHALVRLDSVYGASANDGVGKEKRNLSTP